MRKFLFCLVILSFFLFSSCEADEEIFTTDNQTKTTNTSNTILLEIKGEINRPGIYEMKKGTTLFELIEIAGGLKSSASTDGLDLLKSFDENDSIIISSGSNIIKEETKININTASLTELQTLNGIGP